MMKGRGFVRAMGAVLFALALVGLMTGVFSQGETIRWKEPVSGNWSDPTKWDLGRVPTASDNVVIDAAGTYTVSLNQNATVASLTLGGASGTQTLSQSGYTLTLNGASTIGGNGVYNLNGGTLTGSGSLTVNGMMNWSEGKITGTGAFIINGTLNIIGTGDKILDGRKLSLAGTTNYTGLYLRLVNAGVIENKEGATFKFQGDNIIYDYGGEGTGAFNNLGTVAKVEGIGYSFVNVAFNNSGLVQVLIGRLYTPTYTQTATGTLEIGIGGLTPGEFGVLVSKLATLDGTFKATLVRNFQPKTGDQFLVMAFDSHSGDFASFNLPEGFQSEYIGSSLLLTMIGGQVNQPPLAPNLLSPAENAAVSDFPFTFQLSATDPNNDSLKFKITQVATLGQETK